MTFTFQPIGTIYSPHKTLVGMPIQPSGASGVKGEIDLLPEYVDGLVDLNGFSHLILLYAFHKVDKFNLTVTPFLDDAPHGVFATRAPTRPNPIGLSVVKLLSIKGHTLAIENVDVLNNTPLLDIKPYVPAFDQCPDAKIGWLEKAEGKIGTAKADDRFV